MKVYVPLLPEDTNIPKDIKSKIMDNPFSKNDNITLALVYGKYPMFDWNNEARIQDMMELINTEFYLMITNHEI